MTAGLQSRLGFDPRPLTRLDVISFLAPALVAVEIRVVGRLFLTELILLASIPFLLAARKRYPLDRATTLIVVFGALWLASQVLTDLVRHTAFHNFSRGWADIFFTFSTLIALDLIFSNQRRRLALFALGLAVGLLLQYFFNPDPLAKFDSWKFGLGLPITLILVLAASTRTAQRIPLLPAAFLCVAAALNLLEGFRSLGGVCFLAAGYVAVRRLFSRRPHPGRGLSVGRAFALLAVTLVLAFTFLEGYSYAAAHGLLGNAAAAKYRNQSSGKVAGVLIDGRPEVYIQARAIIDSPIIGHGSWAVDPRYAREGLAALARAGYHVDPNIAYALLQTPQIPTHSYLLGGWVEAGVLGGLFWLVVLGLVGAVFLTVYRVSDPIIPLIAFFMMFLTWNILFSPFGAEQRLIAAYGIVVMLYGWRLTASKSDSPSDPARYSST